MTTPSAESTAPDDPADSPPEPSGSIRHASTSSSSETVPAATVSWCAPSSCKLDLGWIESLLIKACGQVLPTVRRLSIRIVGDEEMARLHEAHAGVAGTTDVLTFDASDPGRAIEADIAICVDEAERQAEAFGHSVEHELLLYAVHGLLHCIGFDDHTDADYARMHAEEDRLLEAIGAGRIFLPTRGDGERAS